MDKELFKETVERVQPHIKKEKTLDVGLRFAITLRHLATGSSYKSLGYGFSVERNTICKIVPKT